MFMIYKIVFWTGKTGVGAGTSDALRQALGDRGYGNFSQSVTRPLFWSAYRTLTLPGKQLGGGTTQRKKNLYEMCAVYRNPNMKELLYTVYRAEFKETLLSLDGKEKHLRHKKSP